MVKLKISVINILLTSCFFTTFYLFNFREGKAGYFVLLDLAISFIIYFVITIFLIAFIFSISLVLEEVMPKSLSEKRVKYLVLFLAYSIILLPAVYFFVLDAKIILVMACVAIIFNVLLEMLSEMRFRHRTGNEIVHTLFNYALIGIIPLFAVLTIVIGVFT